MLYLDTTALPVTCGDRCPNAESTAWIPLTPLARGAPAPTAGDAGSRIRHPFSVPVADPPSTVCRAEPPSVLSELIHGDGARPRQPIAQLHGGHGVLPLRLGASLILKRPPNRARSFQDHLIVLDMRRFRSDHPPCSWEAVLPCHGVFIGCPPHCLLHRV